MDRDTAQKNAFSYLYPATEPYRTHWLDVGEGHTLYVEECGNPNGIPVLVIHGGPGGGCSPAMRRFFDPAAYRIILFDQRGCGLSRPHAEIRANTTWHLVADMEHIRQMLKVERLMLFGGSWGSTLALIYAQAHPAAVTAMVLRGIFLMTEPELQWFYGGGAGKFWPQEWDHFVAEIPQNERGDLIAAYHKRLFSDDRATEDRFAQIWTTWENALASMRRTGGPMPNAGLTFSRAFARIENHYFTHRGFLGPQKQILDHMDRLAHIPGIIVQGRFDMVTPPEAAYRLHQRWPASELVVPHLAGHAMTEPATTEALVAATNRFREKLRAH